MKQENDEIHIVDDQDQEINVLVAKSFDEYKKSLEGVQLDSDIMEEPQEEFDNAEEFSIAEITGSGDEKAISMKSEEYMENEDQISTNVDNVDLLECVYAQALVIEKKIEATIEDDGPYYRQPANTEINVEEFYTFSNKDSNSEPQL